MEKQLFIVYFLTVSGALSCCIPEKWEGHQSVIVGQIMGDKGELIEVSQIMFLLSVCLKIIPFLYIFKPLSKIIACFYIDVMAKSCIMITVFCQNCIRVDSRSY